MKAPAFRAIKRCFDVVVAALGLFILSALMALIWIAVICTSRGPGIHYSARVGRYGRIFIMPKFRTMTADAPVCARETLEGSEQRITRVGKVLRRTGLDELPQLVCVLSGEMSLIGPRPLLEDDPGASERTKFPGALEVRPGISGLAQISGRNSVPARRKARLDAFYARANSLGFEVVLLVRTVGVIISGKGFM